MKWNICAPFFKSGAKNNWIDDFVISDRHSFEKISTPLLFDSVSWHLKKNPTTLLSEWVNHFIQGGTSLSSDADGVITVFPQLPIAVGLQKKVRSSKVPVIAYCFNVGRLYPGFKRIASKFVLQEIDKFVVHSSKEVETVSRWLGFDESRFEFIPLQRANIQCDAQEDVENPFILSMGSANRDYKTFFAAVKGLPVRVIVVASEKSLEGLEIPRNVELKRNLSSRECHVLARRARINVIPLADSATASGQVTLVEAMNLGCAVVATSCCGTVDYVSSGDTGLLIKPQSVDSMRSAIMDLWGDEKLRDNCKRRAQIHAKENFSDEAAAKRLKMILNTYL